MAKRFATERIEADDRPAKKLNTGHSIIQLPNINNARELQQLVAFHQDTRELRNGIQKFKLFLESIVYPQDETLAQRHKGILRTYLDTQTPRDTNDEESIHVRDIILTWRHAAEKNDDTLFSSTTAVLALLLKTLSSKIELRDHGLSICRTLLYQDQARLLSRGLSTSKQKEHIISPTLRLLTEIVSFDGGAMGRQLYSKREMTFEPKLMARHLSTIKLQPEAETDPQAKSHLSVRANAIRYLLANLKLQSEAVVIDIIKQGNITRSLFDGLHHDQAFLIAEVLSIIDAHVVRNQGIPWIEKGRLFGERNLSTLCLLYRTQFLDEQPLGGVKSVLDQFHDFMLHLCTSNNSGVVRHSAGWYPPYQDAVVGGNEADAATDSLEFDPSAISYGESRHKVVIRNILLADLIQNLRPHASDKERELVLAIFKAAPELVADYWVKKINFSFEPKLTATWVGFAALIFSSVALDAPRYFGQKNGYSSQPPPISTVMENLLPSPLNHKVLTRCLGSSSNMITLFGVRIISIALQKVTVVMNLADEANSTLTAKSWATWKEMILSSILQRCPEIKEVITAFRRVVDSDVIMNEAITRLLKLYYEVIPQLAFTEKFDISTSLTAALQESESLNHDDPDSAMKLLTLTHLIQIAQRSSAMSWWKRPDSLKHSPFLTLLLVYAKSVTNATTELRSLLQTVVRESGILQVETQNSALDALAQTFNAHDDEGLLVFIDDCFQRFIKRPIVYEDQFDELLLMKRIVKANAGPVSLWLMTLVEQWQHVEKARKESVEAIGIWLADFISALKYCGEDEAIIDVFASKIEETAPKSTRSVFKKRTKLQAEVSIKPNGLRNGTYSLSASGPDEPPKLDLTRFAPVQQVSQPNFVKFKVGDVSTLLESPSMLDLLLNLSSTDASARIQAVQSIQHFLPRLFASNIEEKELIYLLLGELVETYQTISEPNNDPLPYIVTTFAVHAFQVLRDPTNAMFPKVAGYLTLRPNWSPFRLVRYFLDDIILQQPSEETDVGPWKEINWLLNWLYDGLRTAPDAEILRQVGTWEKLASLGAHPSLGSSKARLAAEQATDTRLQHRVRTLVVQLLGRALQLDQGKTLVTKIGVLAWLDSWKSLGWIQNDLADSLKESLTQENEEAIGQWTFQTVLTNK